MGYQAQRAVQSPRSIIDRVRIILFGNHSKTVIGQFTIRVIKKLDFKVMGNER